jgi:hypothetical protein
MERKQSFFMTDDSKSNTKEVVMDFFVSWTLRYAALNSYDSKYPLLNGYCRRILSMFLFDNANAIEVYDIAEVKTWKQWKQIDLCTEVTLVRKDSKQVEKYALLLEDKVYSQLHGNQPESYKKVFEENYASTDFEHHLVYVYLTLQDNVPAEDQRKCDACDFRTYNLEGFTTRAIGKIEEAELTGNPLFDGFWIDNWS